MHKLICKVCGNEFESRRTVAKFRGRKCYFQSRAGRDVLTDAGRARLSASKTGAKNPTRNPEVAKKISEHHKQSGRFVGKNNPRFKGGWKTRAGHGRGQEYFYVWVDPAERAEHPTINKRGYIHRSHYVWNNAYPQNKVQHGQVVHHINGDALDDRVENLCKVQTQRDHLKQHHADDWEVARNKKRGANGRYK